MNGPYWVEKQLEDGSWEFVALEAPTAIPGLASFTKSEVLRFLDDNRDYKPALSYLVESLHYMPQMARLREVLKRLFLTNVSSGVKS